MSPRPQTPAKTALGRTLQAIMIERGIETQSELALRIKRAGYRRGIDHNVISQWMSGASKPINIRRFCYYLDKALTLTPEEKQSVAASVGWLKYPLPRQIHDSE